MSKMHHNTPVKSHMPPPKERRPVWTRERILKTALVLFILLFILSCSAIVFLRLFSAKIRLILSIVVCAVIALLVLFDILDDTVFEPIRSRKIEKMFEEIEMETVIESLRFNGYVPNAFENMVFFSAFGKRYVIHSRNDDLILECIYYPSGEIDTKKLKEAQIVWLGGSFIGPTDDTHYPQVRLFYEFQKWDRDLYSLRKSIPQMCEYMSNAIERMMDKYYGYAKEKESRI